MKTNFGLPLGGVFLLPEAYPGEKGITG